MLVAESWDVQQLLTAESAMQTSIVSSCRVVNLTFTFYRIYVFDCNYSCNYTASAVRMNFTLFTPICNYRQIGATGENSGNMCQKYGKFHSFVGVKLLLAALCQ